MEQALNTEVILEVKNVTKAFGGLKAVANLSFAIVSGQITALIGPNGAGKTTTFNLISGLNTLTAGEIIFMGRLLRNLSPHRIAGLGIARTFQTPQTFGHLTVLENVMVGCHIKYKTGLLASGFKMPSDRKLEAQIKENALIQLKFVSLEGMADELAGNLPFGQQRYLEIARALAGNPLLMLMDEPASGLSPGETDNLMDLLFEIRDRGVTILLVEHNMRLVMSTADYVVVLDHGEKLAEGTPAVISRDEAVQRAYLGGA